jgi:sugar lactone lactonase YvrE
VPPLDFSGAVLYPANAAQPGAETRSLQAGKISTFAQTAGTVGGFAFSAGTLYATREGVQVFDPAGRLSGILLRPARTAVTALAFGGAERNVLFILCDGKLWQRKTKVKGVP